MNKKIWIITLFPEYFEPLKNFGVLGKALRGERNLENFNLEVETLSLRDFSFDKYKGVDDTPVGGGGGMVMRADVLENALVQGVCQSSGKSIENIKKDFKVIFPCPRGIVWNTQVAEKFATDSLFKEEKDLIFICGRYEGIDERFLDKYVDEYYSLGDYILTGGELAVMVMIDSAMRFVPGVLGNKLSAHDESFSDGLLEHPQYTRPRDFLDQEIPEILFSGHHQKIQEFNLSEKIRLTKKFRPDLWEKYNEK